MTSFISTYSINLNNLKFKDKEVFDDWENLICENEGSFTSDGQYMTFDCDGIEICIGFELCVSGRVYHDSGDYWNPPYTDVDITDVDVTIENLYVDDWEVVLTKEMIKSLEKAVKNNLD
jgi:hypothetical protein